MGQEGAEQQRHELAERQIRTGARHEVGLSIILELVPPKECQQDRVGGQSRRVRWETNLLIEF